MGICPGWAFAQGGFVPMVGLAQGGPVPIVYMAQGGHVPMVIWPSVRLGKRAQASQLGAGFTNYQALKIMS